MRTTELDKHWAKCPPRGGWYCYTCGFYSGQPEHHHNHDIFYIGHVHDSLCDCTLKISDTYPVAESEPKIQTGNRSKNNAT